MDYEILLKENQMLKEQNEKLIKELEERKEHLKNILHLNVRKHIMKK